LTFGSLRGRILLPCLPAFPSSSHLSHYDCETSHLIDARRLSMPHPNDGCSQTMIVVKETACDHRTCYYAGNITPSISGLHWWVIETPSRVSMHLRGVSADTSKNGQQSHHTRPSYAHEARIFAERFLYSMIISRYVLRNPLEPRCSLEHHALAKRACLTAEEVLVRCLALLDCVPTSLHQLGPAFFNIVLWQQQNDLALVQVHT
jgi:hypothetical protein